MAGIMKCFGASTGKYKPHRIKYMIDTYYDGDMERFWTEK